MSRKKSKRTWRTWHLMILFTLGTLIERAGERMREWSAAALKKVWFPE